MSKFKCQIKSQCLNVKILESFIKLDCYTKKSSEETPTQKRHGGSINGRKEKKIISDDTGGPICNLGFDIHLNFELCHLSF